jgi:hypothetical protein
MRKTIGIITLLVLVIGIKKSNAQVHVDINVGTRPVYVAPVPVREVSYYYLPDDDVYYYVPEKRYYYQYEGRWVSAPRYRNCNVYSSRRVAVYESRPYIRHEYYRSKYHGSKHQYRGKGKGQKHRHRDDD